MSTTRCITHLIVRLDTGGAETSLLRLIAGTRNSLTHHVICFGPPTALGQKIEDLGVQVSWLNYRRSGPWVLWQAFKQLRQQPPDILQGWMYYGNVLASCLAWCLHKTRSAKTASDGAKVAWNVRSAMQNPGAENRLIRVALTFSRWCRPGLIIFNSYAGQSIHQNLGILGNQQVVIPNGIDLSEYQVDQGARARQRQHYQVADQVWVGVVGRMHSAKGIREYLLAVAALKASELDARFFLAGVGMTTAHTEFRDLLRETGVPASALDLLGPIDNMADFLPAVDLLVVPSLREGTPNVLLEAMACGVNTVATDVGDVARIVREPARLAAPGNVDELVSTILNALEETTEEAQQRMASEAQFMQQNYAASQCMQAYCDHYESLLVQSSNA